MIQRTPPTQADPETHVDFESKYVTIWDRLRSTQVQGWFTSPASGAVHILLFHQQVRDKQEQHHDVKRKKRRVASVLPFYVITQHIYFCLKF